jgi:pyruvate dehydrogenase E1 component alpha subunit
MPSELDRSAKHALLYQMLLIRSFEEKCAQLYSEAKIRGFLHLYIGEEAVAVGALSALREDDRIVATYREHGQALVRGIEPGAVMAEMYGKANGCARGRGGSMHLFSREKRFYGGHAIVGGGLPVALGLALADQLQDKPHVTASFFGDGATDEGEFHEALNLAALWKLPVLFLCENNLYAMGTFISKHEADTDLVHKPAGYGIAAEQVDGMDVLAVRQACLRGLEYIRREQHPYFIELRTYRFRAHSMYDAELYRDKAEVERWKERDPIVLFRDALSAGGELEPNELRALQTRASETVAAAVATAEAGAWEPISDLSKDVYTEAG